MFSCDVKNEKKIQVHQCFPIVPTIQRWLHCTGWENRNGSGLEQKVKNTKTFIMCGDGNGGRNEMWSGW